MLKSIRVKNFVHFYEEQKLEFVEGAHYFFGQNGTGKSCMVEAIRRCMSTSKNWGISSSHNPDEHSMVICDFEVEGNMVRSGVVRFPREPKSESTTTNKDVFLKFVFEKKTKPVLFMDLVRKYPDRWVVNEAFQPNTKEVEEMAKCLSVDTCTFRPDLLKRIENTDTFREFIKDEHEVNYTSSTECEKYLLDKIDKNVVNAYPARGIATVQWTNSRKFDVRNREENNKTVKEELRKGLEIISWYYNLPDEEIDAARETVDQYFKAMTDNSTLFFEKKGHKIVAYENDQREKALSLGKVPEGYLEAKNCAILLAMPKFKTICIEEAGRGMHPQMIERMRDLVLERIQDKVVIITNHLPTFMTALNMPRIFFFSKLPEIQTFKVFTSKEILPTDGKNAARILTSPAYSTISFARRVLFVEGEKDNIFISTLRLNMLQDEKLTTRLIKKLCRPNQELNLETFNKFMYSLHILALNGHQNKQKFHIVYTNLSYEHYFLLDHDAVIKVVDKSEIPDTKEQKPAIQLSVNSFLGQFNYDQATKADALKDVACLSAKEKYALFVWRKSISDYYKTSIAGTIEGALVSLVKEADIDVEEDKSLKKCFEENRVKLKWDDVEEKDPSFKLFSCKDLTDDNITKVFQGVLEACLKVQTEDMDFLRFLRFLFDRASASATEEKKRKLSFDSESTNAKKKNI